jgi:hypothetical protein
MEFESSFEDWQSVKALRSQMIYHVRTEYKEILFLQIDGVKICAGSADIILLT